MAHGYLHEGYGMWGDFDPDREGRDRDRDRERNWRDPDRSFMFEDRDRDRFRQRGGDEREWFGGRERGEDRSAWEGNREWPERHRGGRYGREHGFGGFQGDYSGGREQGGFGGYGDYGRGRSSFSANPDDHYRSWRDKQMNALDRDYADYCREREQQFHQDFDSWRQGRHGNPQPLQTGMAQTGQSHDPTGERQMANEASGQPDTEQEPIGTATLGSTSGKSRR